VQQVVNGVLREALLMAIAPLVITAPLKLPLSIKNSDAPQENGPPSVLPIPLLGVQTVS
jgi:hypothetical protein